MDIVKENTELMEKLHQSSHISEFFKLYEYKLKVFRSDPIFKPIAEKYWNLLEKNFHGEIEKREFIKLFTKIYKLILPLYNYEEINKFIDNEWNINCMNKPTMNLYLFRNYLFRIAHFWCIHVNKNEYDCFLNLLYGRLIKYKKYYPSKFLL